MFYLKIVPFSNFSSQAFPGYTYSSNEKLSVGQIVEIEFGKKNVQGLIIELSENKPLDFDVKPIKKILTPCSIFTLHQVELAKFISNYYYCSLGLVFKNMAPKIPKRQSTISQATKKIKITKSSKTEIFRGNQSWRWDKYQSAIKKCLDSNLQILFVVPETILAYQALDIFAQKFPDHIVDIMHSKLSTGQIYKTWLDCLNGNTNILIGTKQAIFSPFNNLGLIIIDDEYSASHKQWDMSPRYDARLAASMLKEISGANIIFGSASTSINQNYQTIINKKNSLSIQPKTAKNVKIVDMRNELRSGNFSIFSHSLSESIKNSISNNRQVILFVNRRASSSSFLCRDCGYVIKCESCKIPLSEYSNGKLVCIHCNFKISAPEKCPKCNSDRIKGFGIGTEKVAANAAKQFGARVVVLDHDKQKNRHDTEKIYQNFETGNANIIVGTQAVLSLISENIDVVGIINIDSILNMPDWRSAEKSFNIISQAIGNFAKEIIIQTYNPENEIINLASEEKYDIFYNNELKQRKELNYPPFCDLIKLTYKNISKEKVLKEEKILLEKIKKLNFEFEPMIRKQFLKNNFICSIIIKNKKLNDKIKIFNILNNNWSVDINPETLL